MDDYKKNVSYIFDNMVEKKNIVEKKVYIYFFSLMFGLNAFFTMLCVLYMFLSFLF